MIPLVIVGAGGHGREILDVVDAINAAYLRFRFLGFVADGHHDEDLLVRRGSPYLGEVATLEGIDAQYVVAIGSGTARRRIDRMASSWGKTAAILVHPTVTVGFDVTLGAGTVVAAGGRLTTNIRLGRHVHMNVNSSVSHDCEIGDYATLSPGANVSGKVTIGEGVTLGTNAAIVPGVTIGAETLIGAGAVVVGDLGAGLVAVGVPARPLARRDADDASVAGGRGSDPRSQRA